QVGFQVFDNQKMIDQVNEFNRQITANKSTPPDLKAFANDALGFLKIENTFMAQTLRTNPDGTLSDRPSTFPLPAHQPATDVAFQHLSGLITDSLSYKGWNGESWTAQTWGGWFVQTCADGTKLNSNVTGKCTRPDSIGADLNFINWSFNE